MSACAVVAGVDVGLGGIQRDGFDRWERPDLLQIHEYGLLRALVP